METRAENELNTEASKEETFASGIAALMPFARSALPSFMISAVLAAVATLLSLVPY
jgi:hypothetical protein